MHSGYAKYYDTHKRYEAKTAQLQDNEKMFQDLQNTVNVVVWHEVRLSPLLLLYDLILFVYSF